MDWLMVFGDSSGDVSGLQMCARGVVILIYGVVVVRLLGRRIFGQRNVLDIVLGVLFGSNLSRALTGNAPLLATLIGTTALVVLYAGLLHASVRWTRFSWLFKGCPVKLVSDGRLDHQSLHRRGLGEGDLNAALRSQGYADLNGVSEVYLERNGNISVIARSD